MIITPAEFYAWLALVPLVLAPGCFLAGVMWRRGAPTADELADLDTPVEGDEQIDAYLAALRGDPPTRLVFPERPVLAAVGPLAASELKARAAHPCQPAPPAYTELDAWRAEERAMATGAESTASRLLHLIVGGMAMRDDLPQRAAAAAAAARKLLEADQ